MTTPKPNTDLSLAFLDILDKNGRHDLCAIHPDLPNGASGKLEAATFLPDDHGDLREWIDAQQGKRNVYVSVNRARDDESVDWRLSKDDIGVIRAIYADIDPKKVGGGDASGQHFRKERERLDALAKQLRKEEGCPPSLIVDSGGGIQPWWMLRPPVPATPENVALVEGIGRTLKARFGGDSVFDVSRILRLTGTINIPDAGKLAQGRTPALATILAEESSGETYTLDQIAEWAPPTPEHAKPKDRPATAIDMGAVYTSTFEDLPVELRKKFEAHCASRPVVGALWRGEPAPWQGGESPSEYVFALATALRPSGAFTVTEFAQLVAVWEHRSETHADDFERYVSRAWNRNPAPLGGEGFDPHVLPARGAGKIEWNEPADLWSARFEPVDLPAGVVPQAIECVARDQAKRLGVEAGACAAALVTAIGSLVPAGNQMQMRQHDTGWTVKAILWTAIIGEVGENKSATLKAATNPVIDIEKEWAKQYATERRDYDRINATKQKPAAKVTAAKDATAKLETPEAPLSISPEDWLDVAREPVMRRKVVQDATTEKLCEILSKNPDGLLFFADELAGLFGGMDSYRAKAGKDRPLWLQAKEGGPYTVDRRSHDTLRVDNLAISVLGGIQPSKIKALGAGLAEDGMLQRFLPIILKRLGAGEDVAPNKAYAESLERIAGVLVNSEQSGRFKFTPEGDCELRKIQDFQQTEIKRPGASPALRQWLDKTPNEFGRLALVFHFIEWHASPGAALVGGNPPPLVSEATARRARRFLMEFAYPHARVFHQQVLGRSVFEEHTAWIGGHILAHGLSAVTLRDIYKNYTPFKQPEARRNLADIMHALETEDWLCPCPGRLKEGRPTQWFVNPAAHEAFATKAATEREARVSAQGSIREEAARRRLERPGGAEPETPRHPTAPLEGSTTALSSLA